MLARRHADFAAAEDAVQEALTAAATHWPSEGLPNNPHGWLCHVATRRLVDQMRSEVSSSSIFSVGRPITARLPATTTGRARAVRA